MAFDSARKELGIAVASCVPLDVLRQVPGVVPERGAFVTQSFLLPDARLVAEGALARGASADQTLAAMIDPSFDPSFDVRQYAVIDVDGGAAVFTGKDDAVYNASHRVGRLGPFVYTMQGNILAGRATLDNMEAGFVADVCDLPERLMRALETASFDRGGDNRCVLGEGRPAQSAILQVPAAGLALEIDVADPGGIDPTLFIRAQLDTWRATHPCPTSETLTNTSDEGCRVGASSTPFSSTSAFEPLAMAPLVIVALRTTRRFALERKTGGTKITRTAPRRPHQESNLGPPL